jgi:hypothetical protein
MNWTTNGTKYSVIVPRFASNLGLAAQTKYPKNLHDESSRAQ